jgi:hypothetical protein
MSARRAPWAFLLAAFLLLGVVDFHPAGESHGTFAPSGSKVYFPGAEHPSQPAHFEAAQEAQQPSCPLCLHRLQTSGAHLRPVSGLALPAPRIALERDTAAPPSRISRRLDGARAPPFLS